MKSALLTFLLLKAASAFKYEFNNQTFAQQLIKDYSRGFVEEYLPSKQDKFCDSWAQFPGTSLISANRLTVAYLLMLLYLFIGLTLLQDTMFGAIEVLLS